MSKPGVTGQARDAAAIAAAAAPKLEDIANATDQSDEAAAWFKDRSLHAKHNPFWTAPCGVSVGGVYGFPVGPMHCHEVRRTSPPHSLPHSLSHPPIHPLTHSPTLPYVLRFLPCAACFQEGNVARAIHLTYESFRQVNIKVC
jgi:hypothetical protein